MKEKPKVQLYQFNGTEIPIDWGYYEANVLFPQMGFTPLRVFQDEQVLLTVLGDDEVMLKVWYHYVSPFFDDFDSALKQLTPESMETFKNLIWERLIAFTHPSLRQLAREMRSQAEEALSSPKTFLENASLNSKQSSQG